MLIIAIENPLAQHLHVNPGLIDEKALASAGTWSVRVTGDFIIFINNHFNLPVIVRHPQRFNDSRSFMTAFKRNFIQMLELAPIPHAKIRLIRDAQFKQISFGRQIPVAVQQRLQRCESILTGPNSLIDWGNQPTNAQLALKMAENIVTRDSATGDHLTASELLENYVMENYQLPAHPHFNEHNRTYLYRSQSLNDIMNATMVSEHFLHDYATYLTNRRKSDQIIDRDIDTATDYLTYCEGNGVSVLADLGLVYDYLLSYEKRNDVQLSDSRLRSQGIALRELGRFLRYQELFSAEDFDQFVQAIGQGMDNLASHLRIYHLQRWLWNMQQQFEGQRSAMERARHFRSDIYTLTVTLVDYQPMMWRRFELSGATRLDQLCYQILASFHAQGNHLFEISDGDHHYQLPVFENGIDNERNIQLQWLGDYQPGAQLTLTYDFGDNWQFQIEVNAVKKQSRLRGDVTAKLVDGSGIGIIDDIGGVTGLMKAAQDDPTINRAPDLDHEQKIWRQRVERLRQNYA